MGGHNDWFWPLALLWIGGFVTLKVLAAYEAGERTWSGTLEALVWLGWTKGRTRRARWYARLAWAWLIVLFAAVLLMSA